MSSNKTSSLTVVSILNLRPCAVVPSRLDPSTLWNVSSFANEGSVVNSISLFAQVKVCEVGVLAQFYSRHS